MATAKRNSLHVDDDEKEEEEEEEEEAQKNPAVM
jgi:hypothetical protein